MSIFPWRKTIRGLGPAIGVPGEAVAAAVPIARWTFSDVLGRTITDDIGSLDGRGLTHDGATEYLPDPDFSEALSENLGVESANWQWAGAAPTTLTVNTNEVTDPDGGNRAIKIVPHDNGSDLDSYLFTILGSALTADQVYTVTGRVRTVNSGAETLNFGVLFTGGISQWVVNGSHAVTDAWTEFSGTFTYRSGQLVHFHLFTNPVALATPGTYYFYDLKLRMAEDHVSSATEPTLRSFALGYPARPEVDEKIGGGTLFTGGYTAISTPNAWRESEPSAWVDGLGVAHIAYSNPAQAGLRYVTSSDGDTWTESARTTPGLALNTVFVHPTNGKSYLFGYSPVDNVNLQHIVADDPYEFHLGVASTLLSASGSWSSLYNVAPMLDPDDPLVLHLWIEAVVTTPFPYYLTVYTKCAIDPVTGALSEIPNSRSAGGLPYANGQAVYIASRNTVVFFTAGGTWDGRDDKSQPGGFAHLMMMSLDWDLDPTDPDSYVRRTFTYDSGLGARFEESWNDVAVFDAPVAFGYKTGLVFAAMEGVDDTTVRVAESTSTFEEIYDASVAVPNLCWSTVTNEEPARIEWPATGAWAREWDEPTTWRVRFRVGRSGTDPLTIAGSWPILSTMLDGTDKGIVIYAKATGIGVTLRHDANTYLTAEALDAGVDIDDADWHDVVVSHDGSGTAAGVTITIDGTGYALDTATDGGTAFDGTKTIVPAAVPGRSPVKVVAGPIFAGWTNLAIKLWDLVEVYEGVVTP